MSLQPAHVPPQSAEVAGTWYQTAAYCLSLLWLFHVYFTLSLPGVAS